MAIFRMLEMEILHEMNLLLGESSCWIFFIRIFFDFQSSWDSWRSEWLESLQITHSNSSAEFFQWDVGRTAYWNFSRSQIRSIPTLNSEFFQKTLTPITSFACCIIFCNRSRLCLSHYPRRLLIQHDTYIVVLEVLVFQAILSSCVTQVATDLRQ